MYSLYGNGDVGGKSDGQVDVEGDGNTSTGVRHKKSSQAYS